MAMRDRMDLDGQGSNVQIQRMVPACTVCTAQTIERIVTSPDFFSGTNGNTTTPVHSSVRCALRVVFVILALLLENVSQLGDGNNKLVVVNKGER
jgi:hypothetical protein